LEAVMIAYKFLRPDATSVFTGFRWPLPTEGPGQWVEAPVQPCRSGVHASRLSDLPPWLGRVLYEVELDGDIVNEPTKVIASRARLLRHLDAWDDELRGTYTRMCADRAHRLARGTNPPLVEWDAVVEPSVPEGPPLLGFVAARIAEEIAGIAGYQTERSFQTD
jgi:hypothetical protein